MVKPVVIFSWQKRPGDAFSGLIKAVDAKFAAKT